MELNWLLVFIVFLLQIRRSRMGPTQLVCDRRLIQKYVAEAVEMEETLNWCEAIPLLQEPVDVPLVGFNLREWTSKAKAAKSQEVLQALVKLVDGAAAAQQQLSQGCILARVQQLYEKATFFLLHLKNLQGQDQSTATQFECDFCSISTRDVGTIFRTYKQLLRGKLHFFFHDLWKDSWAHGRPRGPADPPCLATSSGQ